MYQQKIYRRPWTKEKVEWLIEWWPKLGTTESAKRLGLEWQQIKSKVDRLKLHLNEKKSRPCFVCGKNHQTDRRYGYKCKKCFLESRRRKRRSKIWEQKEWIDSVARTLRYRSQKIHNIESDIDTEFLMDLWDKQCGKCYYSGMPLLIYQPGRVRTKSVASIDRKDSNKGYTRDNVVWCAWICNSTKSDFSINDYVDFCCRVASRSDLLRQHSKEGIISFEI